jgi:hypothetical protein
MRRYLLCLLGLVLALGLIFTTGYPVLAEDAPPIGWIHQFGNSVVDCAHGVATDSTGVYVVGDVAGALPGQSSAGCDDAFARKYDASGTEVWTRQFGTGGADIAYGVATDATGIYVVGVVTGALPGQSYAGGSGDAFVRKYDASGTEKWTRQFGTSGDDCAYGVAIDSTGIYVAGVTGGALPGQSNIGSHDVFVRKYDASGTEVWTRQFGTSGDDYAFGVATDANGIYVVGQAGDALPGQSYVGGGC